MSRARHLIRQLVLVATIAGCGDDGESQRPPADVVRQRIAALAPAANIGHRGTGNTRAGHPYPENALSSFDAAIAQGADGIELDVELTADGHLVVMHDDRLDRTTDCEGCVSAMTADEVAQCRLLDGAGAPTEEMAPTLAETFDRLPDDALVNVEMKAFGAACRTDTTGPEQLARAAAAEVIQLGVADRVFFSSFDRTAVSVLKQEHPDLYVALLYTIPTPEQVTWAIDAGLDAIHPLFAVPEADVQTAIDAGLQVNVWTVNRAIDMNTMIDYGVTAIITDEPLLLGQVLDERLGNGG
jgi:glycerophosphoryl diester phosphodiesterase